MYRSFRQYIDHASKFVLHFYSYTCWKNDYESSCSMLMEIAPFVTNNNKGNSTKFVILPPFEIWNHHHSRPFPVMFSNAVWIFYLVSRFGRSTWDSHQWTACLRHYQIRHNSLPPKIVSLAFFRQRIRIHLLPLDALAQSSPNRAGPKTCWQRRYQRCMRPLDHWTPIPVKQEENRRRIEYKERFC